MIESQLKKFRESGRNISAQELCEAVYEVKELVYKQWYNSLSKDSEGREECFRQLKGIDAVMGKLISDNWS